jgi:hypothetical protein
MTIRARIVPFAHHLCHVLDIHMTNVEGIDVDIVKEEYCVAIFALVWWILAQDWKTANLMASQIVDFVLADATIDAMDVFNANAMVVHHMFGIYAFGGKNLFGAMWAIRRILLHHVTSLSVLKMLSWPALNWKKVI